MGNASSGQTPQNPLLRPPPNFTTQWNMKLVYKMIESKQLAPFFPYIPDEEATIYAEECPICLNFLVGGLNRAMCCSKGVCTACFLTIKKTPETPFGCPFCLVPNFDVKYRGPKTQKQIETELEDQRSVDALRKKIRDEEIEADRLREEKRQKEREERSKSISIASVPKTPPNSPAIPLGSPSMPSEILRRIQQAESERDRQQAELEAAIWLSLNPDALDSPTPSLQN